MKSIIKKGLSFGIILMLCILILGNITIVYAKEKTGEEMVAEVIKKLDLEDKSYFDKVLLCGEWIDTNIRYDRSLKNNSLPNTMREKKGTCSGFASVFKEFMDQLGIPCIYISDEWMNHAYNMVLMNDYQWYLIEPQSSLPIWTEREKYEEEIEEYKSEIRYLKEDLEDMSTCTSPECKERIEELNNTLEEYSNEIKQYEEKLSNLKGDGQLIIESNYISDANNIEDDRDNFLNGVKDFKDHILGKKKGERRYYKFVESAKDRLYGYPVAKKKLREDPNPKQKYFIDKSSIKFKKKNIKINAAKMSSDIELPIKIKNYSCLQLFLDLENIQSTNILGITEPASRSLYTDSLFSISKNKIKLKQQGQNVKHNIREIQKLTVETFYGKQASIIVEIKYPQIPYKIQKRLDKGLKVGDKVKLKLTTGGDLKDFYVTINEKGKQYVKYDSKTGELTGKKPGKAIIKLQSKINPKYKISYWIGYNYITMV